MDVITDQDASSPSVSLHSGGPESEISESSVRISSGGDTPLDSESTGEIIARLELDIACICEKVTNLYRLLMHVETKESDFEAFVSDMDPDLVVKALEFDFLSGLLASEVRVLEAQIHVLLTDKANVREFLSSHKHLGEPHVATEDMLHNSEKSLEESLKQVSEIKVQSANFERILLSFAGDKTWKDEDYTESLNDGDLSELQENMKMQAVEHQRHILMMLEKSLERETDLEKRMSESIDIEEALKMRLQDVLYVEGEAEMTLEKLYEADHTSEILMEISKELLSEIKMLQFNLRGSVQREAEMKRDLLALEKRNTEYELKQANEKVFLGGVEMEDIINDYREQAIQADIRVVNAEAKCEGFKDAYKKVVSLVKELSDTRAKLQNVEACYEAIREDKSMLKLTIRDMNGVIDELKRKGSQAKLQTESAEDKCVFLSEENADLKKELRLVRGRVNCLEAALHQTEETKKATAKDISLHAKLITDLVMQMALERERLQNQISSLKQENKTLVMRLRKTESPAVKVSHGDGDKASRRHREPKPFENDLTTMTGAENKESLSTTFKVEKACNETDMDSASEVETTRNIDVRELKLKDILLILIILSIPLFGVLLHQARVR